MPDLEAKKMWNMIDGQQKSNDCLGGDGGAMYADLDNFSVTRREPLKDISILKPEEHLVLIMKDGKTQ